MLKIAVANLKKESGGGSKQGWKFGRHPRYYQTHSHPYLTSTFFFPLLLFYSFTLPSLPSLPSLLLLPSFPPSSGCCQSQWVDNFDAARAAVLPAMVAKMNPGVMAGPEAMGSRGGDPVCVFANQSQCLAAGSLNPLSMCFMGDLTLDVVKQQAKVKVTTCTLVLFF